MRIPLTPSSFTKGLLVLCVWANAQTAAAYRTVEDLSDLSGEHVVWAADELPFSMENAYPEPLTRDDVEAAFEAAAATWSEARCAPPRLRWNGWTGQPAAPSDGRNTISWVFLDWESLGAPEDAAGLADVELGTTMSGTWRIVEVDIYINAESVRWGAMRNPAEGGRSIESVLVHELGHALGLAHPCEEGGGNGAPDCSSSPETALAIMHPFYDPTRLTLSDDDEAGLCYLYPEAPSEEAGTRAPAPLGDPCERDADCASAHCDVPGFCAEVCEEPCERSACPPGDDEASGTDAESDDDGAFGAGAASEASAASEEIRAECEQTLHGLGESCVDSDDCLGGECLSGTEDGNVCSRLCNHSSSDCPEDWSCDEVEGRSVCIPERSGSGCQLLRPARSGFDADAPSTAALLLSMLILRRRRFIHSLRVPPAFQA